MNNIQKRKNNLFKRIILLVLFLSILFIGFKSLIFDSSFNDNVNNNECEVLIKEDKEYHTYKEVATYIHIYKKLPNNYLNKNEARNRGWNGGNPQYDIDENVYIGGDKFMNLEKLLPINEEYFECDVDYYDETRGENRLIYTKDGKVYYTDDHYDSFIELY